VSAVVAATLFGVGGTFAQFLFQHRGVNIDWLVTMRLLGAGGVMLLISAVPPPSELTSRLLLAIIRKRIFLDVSR